MKSKSKIDDGPVAPTSIDQLLCNCMFMALTLGGIKIEKYGPQLEFVSYHIVDNHADKRLALKDKEGTIVLSGKEIKPMLHRFCFSCGRDLRNCIVRR